MPSNEIVILLHYLHVLFVCISGVGVEDNAVDAEVIVDLQNRITETQKDIQVNLPSSSETPL